MLGLEPGFALCRYDIQFPRQVVNTDFIDPMRTTHDQWQRDRQGQTHGAGAGEALAQRVSRL